MKRKATVSREVLPHYECAGLCFSSIVPVEPEKVDKQQATTKLHHYTTIDPSA
jgi:hypothetical protein